MSAVTSKIQTTYTGREGLKKKEIYTATKVTPTTDDSGNKTYKMDIIQYDNKNGDGEKIIGTRNGDKITFNDKASDDIKGNNTAIKNINKDSKHQANTIKNQVATTGEEKKAFNESNAKGNEGTESDNDQQEPTLASQYDGTLSEAGQEVLNSGAGTNQDGTRKEGFGTYVFPQTLREKNASGGTGQDFLKFDMMKYQPKSFSEESFAFSERDSNRKSIGHVILPIPGNIDNNTAVTWGGSTMSPLDMATANLALSGVTGGGGAFVDTAGTMATNLADSFGTNKNALAAVIAGMAAGGQQLLTRTTGAIANPNMELLFGGPNLRTFNFQWLLAPRDQKEAMTLIQILRFFKQGMAPIRTKARLFMKSPHTFRISYRNSQGEQHKYLNKFKECALQSFGVQYTPNGQYSTYKDGVMTAYQMTMSYSELNPIYNDDYGAEGNEMPKEIGF